MLLYVGYKLYYKEIKIINICLLTILLIIRWRVVTLFHIKKESTNILLIMESN